jgi:hypothetical protein
VKRYKGRISPSNEIRITIYPNAYSTKTSKAVEKAFQSFEELAAWLGRQPQRIREKRAVPLFARGRCVGPRKKANLEPPFLVILDVDKSETSLKSCSKRLTLMGVDHAGHTTHSHGAKNGVHSYRVFTDHVAHSWGSLREITAQLFRLTGLELTHESHSSPCFFVPAVHPDRKLLYRHAESLTGGSSWSARRAPVKEIPDFPAAEPTADVEVDVDELWDALERIPNENYHQWIKVGQALHSSGLEEALDLWLDWSEGQDYGSFDEGVCEEKWGTFTEGGGVGLGTVYRLARQGGWAPERATAKEDFAGLVSPRLQALRAFNEQYAYVAIGQGMVAHLRSVEHPVSFMSTRAFLALHLHPEFPTGVTTKSGKAVTEPIGKIWFNWKKRRSYTGRDFLPPGSGEELPADILNIWRGWRYEARPESCALFLKHVKRVICSGDEDLYRWVVAWMAHLVQRPHEKPGTAIVLRSGEGTGKGVFASALVELCGVHGIHLSHPGQLTRSFNSHMEGKLLVFADEVTWGGRRLEEGRLKAMVTEAKGTFEKKGVDAAPGRDFCRVIISSNNEWVVPATSGARRWLVLDVSEDKVGQRHEWHLPILKELRNGGYEGLMHFLGNLDLEEYPDPEEIIQTDALRDQKLESMDPIDQWLRVILNAGRLTEYAEGWPEGYAAKSLLYEGYLQVASEVGIPRKAVMMDVMKRVKRVFGRLREKRTRLDGARTRVIQLPPLDRARRLFEIHAGTEIDWEEEE